MVTTKRVHVHAGNQALVVWQQPLDLLTTPWYSRPMPKHHTMKGRACEEDGEEYQGSYRQLKFRSSTHSKSQKDRAIRVPSGTESTANPRHSSWLSSWKILRTLKARCAKLRTYGKMGLGERKTHGGEEFYEFPGQRRERTFQFWKTWTPKDHLKRQSSD
jgi:hypothetical protein